jgi:hypothetical protein
MSATLLCRYVLGVTLQPGRADPGIYVLVEYAVSNVNWGDYCW